MRAPSDLKGLFVSPWKLNLLRVFLGVNGLFVTLHNFFCFLIRFTLHYWAVDRAYLVLYHTAVCLHYCQLWFFHEVLPHLGLLMSDSFLVLVTMNNVLIHSGGDFFFFGSHRWYHLTRSHSTRGCWSNLNQVPYITVPNWGRLVLLRASGQSAAQGGIFFCPHRIFFTFKHHIEVFWGYPREA